MHRYGVDMSDTDVSLSSNAPRIAKAVKMVFLTTTVNPADAKYACDFHYNQLSDQGLIKTHSAILEEAPEVFCDFCISEVR